MKAPTVIRRLFFRKKVETGQAKEETRQVLEQEQREWHNRRQIENAQALELETAAMASDQKLKLLAEIAKKATQQRQGR